MMRLLGYRNIKTKAGKELTLATVVSDLSEREKATGAVGQKAEDIFLPENQVNALKPEHIGKEFIPTYEVSNGKAYLVNFAIK